MQQNTSRGEESTDRTDEDDSTEFKETLADLTGFQLHALWVAGRLNAEQPAVSGQDISRELGERFDDKPTHGRLYPNLDTLVNYGLIDRRPEQINRRTNAYEVTEKGRAFLAFYDEQIHEDARTMGLEVRR
ncbi:PadR family transcriptional regulator [Halomarina salina]|uniref:PadR family transcriptional regulator n=1 Tax=Halomarina salina TaxID=1872699 RepID=A0ABD5RHW0_9EURY|nr:PadR family transcriptional regulator [Halomarina salina]